MVRTIVIGSLCVVLMLAPMAGAQSPDKLKTTVQDICWSPDGSVIYFSAMRIKADYSDFKPCKWAVYRFDLETKTTTKFVDSALWVSVSPSGDGIAIGKLIDSTRDMYLYNSGGSVTEPITTTPLDEFAASFSPDDKRILFTRRIAKDQTICVFNRQDSSVTELRPGVVGKIHNPSFSPSGKWIVYYLEKGDHKDQIHVMNADGSADRNITNDTLNNYFPNWIDDGTISYAEGRNAMTISVDGSKKRKLGGIKTFYLRYSPDRSLIVYVDDADRCIDIVKPDGTLVHKVCLQ